MKETSTWINAMQADPPKRRAGAPAGERIQHVWNERSRRLIAHHDRSDWAALAWLWLAEARILAARLAV